MITSTIGPKPALRTHGPLQFVREPHKVREARIRRRVGAAYVRLQGGTVEEQGAALGRHHTTISHRRAGQGGLANVALEVDAFERADIDTLPLIVALLEIRAAARAERSAPRCLNVLSQEEQRLDGEEDEAQIAFHATGCSRRWLDATLEYVAYAKAELIPALMREKGGAR